MFRVLTDPVIYEYENAPPESVEWLRARFKRLESRLSPDGSEQWLNWVLRDASNALIGYVQATVYPGHRAGIAYVLESASWGGGLASEAVDCMIAELADRYGVRHLSAVLKRDNGRSMRLLERKGFTLAPAALQAEREIDADETLMLKSIEGRP
jgi:RimJ/RimL family protein N-acetyltransferase